MRFAFAFDHNEQATIANIRRQKQKVSLRRLCSDRRDASDHAGDGNRGAHGRRNTAGERRSLARR
jgi:hypothetical protein